ncbi:MAG: NUDIX domain-containing protein [Candidatus Daviesbacteria bacterium]|nr:NUDIX domain-containing protein [Candidatus Daviesbacteria bacterium]
MHKQSLQDQPLKPFYVSGFLYHLKTQQILLLQSQQAENEKINWSMFGGEGKEGEEAHITFQRIVRDFLNLELKTKHIYPIYDYFHEALDKVNYVFYAEVGKKINLDQLNNPALSWVSFGETLKLFFSAHTKQDLVVGQRVIHLKEREDEAKELNIQIL